jgi:hypothetical protein
MTGRSLQKLKLPVKFLTIGYNKKKIFVLERAGPEKYSRTVHFFRTIYRFDRVILSVLKSSHYFSYSYIL